MDSVRNVEVLAGNVGSFRFKSNDLEYDLYHEGCRVAQLMMPDCPDIDPYTINIQSNLEELLSENIESWVLRSFPQGEYYIKRLSIGALRPDPDVYLGQEKVRGGETYYPVIDDGAYYAVSVVGQGLHLRGSVLLCVSVPDMLIDTTTCGIFMIQIAKTESDDAFVILPKGAGYCLSLHETFTGNEDVPPRLKAWYEKNGAGEIRQLFDCIYFIE